MVSARSLWDGAKQRMRHDGLLVCPWSSWILDQSETELWDLQREDAAHQDRAKMYLFWNHYTLHDPSKLSGFTLIKKKNYVSESWLLLFGTLWWKQFTQDSEKIPLPLWAFLLSSSKLQGFSGQLWSTEGFANGIFFSPSVFKAIYSVSWSDHQPFWTHVYFKLPVRHLLSKQNVPAKFAKCNK